MSVPPRNTGGQDVTSGPARRGSGAVGNDASITLTASALQHARRAGLLKKLMESRMPETATAGDILSIADGDGSHDFVVLRRRWILDGAKRPVLELTLDHPARRGS